MSSCLGWFPERARAAIAAEGATVIEADGSYDEAVEQAAVYADQESAGAGRLLVQDTAWAGYESVPRWIVEGYGTLLAEVDRQFAERELPGPDLVSVPVGVGSLAQAVVTHYRRGERVRAGQVAWVVSTERGTARLRRFWRWSRRRRPGCWLACTPRPGSRCRRRGP